VQLFTSRLSTNVSRYLIQNYRKQYNNNNNNNNNNIDNNNSNWFACKNVISTRDVLRNQSVVEVIGTVKLISYGFPRANFQYPFQVLSAYRYVALQMLYVLGLAYALEPFASFCASFNCGKLYAEKFREMCANYMLYYSNSTVSIEKLNAFKFQESFRNKLLQSLFRKQCMSNLSERNFPPFIRIHLISCFRSWSFISL